MNSTTTGSPPFGTCTSIFSFGIEKPVHAIRRSDHEPHRLTRLHLNRDRVERILARHDLDFVTRTRAAAAAPCTISTAANTSLHPIVMFEA